MHIWSTLILRRWDWEEICLTSMREERVTTEQQRSYSNSVLQNFTRILFHTLEERWDPPSHKSSPKYLKCNWKRLCKYEHFCKSKTKTHSGMCFVLRDLEKICLHEHQEHLQLKWIMSSFLTCQFSELANCQLCSSARCIAALFKVIVTTKMVSENQTEMNHFSSVLQPVKKYCMHKYVNHIFLCL